jgi:hypothetical protein
LNFSTSSLSSLPSPQGSTFIWSEWLGSSIGVGCALHYLAIRQFDAIGPVCMGLASFSNHETNRAQVGLLCAFHIRRSRLCRIVGLPCGRFPWRISVNTEKGLVPEVLTCDQLRRRVATADAQVVAERVFLVPIAVNQTWHHALDDTLCAARRAVYRVALQYHGSAVYAGAFDGCSRDPASASGSAFRDVVPLYKHCARLFEAKISILAELDDFAML